MVEGVLYLSTAMHQVAAVDAATGETLWVHDPQVYLGGPPTHFNNSRGVAYWSDDNDARIFFGTYRGDPAHPGRPSASWKGAVYRVLQLPGVAGVRGCLDF